MRGLPYTSQQEGFALVDAMLGVATLGLVVTALVGALIVGSQSSVFGGQRARASQLAAEGIAATRNLRDNAVNNLKFTQSGVQTTGTIWSFLGESTTETIGEFTRTITFDDVCRDASKVHVACPGTYIDPHTRKVTVAVSWTTRSGTDPSSVTRVTYLSSWASRFWEQTDWIGGTGQATWSDATRYDSDDGNVDVSVAGQVALELVSPGVYRTAGSLQSSAFTMSDTSPVELIEWDQDLTGCVGCSIQFQVRSAPDSGGSPGTWTAWHGLSGSATYFTAHTGSRIPVELNGNRWVQYRVELAGDGSTTPILQAMRIFYR